MKKLYIGIGAGLLPIAAQAYIGPGAGLSLLGALWALILALCAALFFIIAFPVRAMLRRHRKAKQAEMDSPDADQLDTSYGGDDKAQHRADNDSGQT